MSAGRAPCCTCDKDATGDYSLTVEPLKCMSWESTYVPAEVHLLRLCFCCDVLKEFYHFGENVVRAGVSQDLTSSGSLLQGREGGWKGE